MKALLLTAGLVLAPAAAFAQASPQDFAAMAASGGIYEIRSSEMILNQEGLDPDVRAFAEQMVSDHTKAAAELAAAAEAAGVSVPSEPLSREATKLMQLEAAPDKTKLYLMQQDTAHDSAIVLHRSYAAGGTDDRLKAYAQAVIPVLEEHGAHIQTLNEGK